MQQQLLEKAKQQQQQQQQQAAVGMEPGAGELLLGLPPATCNEGKNRLDAEAFLCNYYSSISAAAAELAEVNVQSHRFDVHRKQTGG